MPAELLEIKREIRTQAHANRRDQPDKDELSRRICARFASLEEYAAAQTVMLYVHTRSEVRTQTFLSEAIGAGKRVVVPYCVAGQLELFHLEDLGELALGTFGILEPKESLRDQPSKRPAIDELDLVMVPGVAFDRDGGRLGHGKGYYDKLLHAARPDTPLVGVAFECQLFPRIPMLPHDVFMNRVVTEKAAYPGRRHSPQPAG
jgi:5-formyltetrahydrofolate cyclo-ligase